MTQSSGKADGIPSQGSARRLRKIFDSSGFRYLLIGGLSFAIDFGLLSLLYQVFGVQLWIATAAAFLASFLFNYCLQKIFSFGSTSAHGTALIKYTSLVVFNTLATVLIVGLIEPSALGWAGGKVIATVITTFWNYFAYKFWVFPRRDLSTEGIRPEKGLP